MAKPTLLQNIFGRPSRQYSSYYPVVSPPPSSSFSRPPPSEQHVWQTVAFGGTTYPVPDDTVEAAQHTVNLEDQQGEHDDDDDDDLFFTPPETRESSPRQSTVLDTVHRTSSTALQPATAVPFPTLAGERTKKPIEHIRPQNTDRMPSNTTTTTSTTTSTKTTATTATSRSRTSSGTYTDFSFNAGQSSTSRTTPMGTLSRSNSSSSQPLKSAGQPVTRTTHKKVQVQVQEKPPAVQEWSKDVKWLVSPQEMERQAQAKEMAKARAKVQRQKEKAREKQKERAKDTTKARSREPSPAREATTMKSSSSGSGSTTTTAGRSRRSKESLRTTPSAPSLPPPSKLPPDFLLDPISYPLPHAYTHPPEPRPSSIPDRPPTLPRARARRASATLVAGLQRMSDVPELDEGELDAALERSQQSTHQQEVQRQPSIRQTRTHTQTNSLPSPSRLRTTSTISSQTPSQSVSGGEPRNPSHVSRSHTTASTSAGSSHRTVVLPTPMPISAPTTSSFQQGYTSLTLPHAGYVPSKHPERDAVAGKVDVTRLGIGQAAMATVSVIRGAAGESTGMFRARTLSISRQRSCSEDGTRPSSGPPSRPFIGKTNSVGLAFSVRTPPPSRVPPTSVLVRVHACALDKLDAVMLREKGEYGYIPGRSFVGVVVEAGWGCEDIGKGDWVWGLLDARKPGALAEFILVDKHHLTPCPHPTSVLSVAQLAILPMVGVPAHRAARTASNLSAGSRALVLLGSARDGGTGPGVLATREMVAMGLEVVVQVESGDEDWADGVARACDADAVFTGSALECLYSMSSSDQAKFDLVLDCVGGRDIWHTVRRGGVIRPEALSAGFTTLVGDRPGEAPTLGAQIRSNLRSLRRAFLSPGSASQQDARDSASQADGRQQRNSKGDGHVSRIEYEWISPLHSVDREGEDIKDTLTAVAALAGQGVLVPFLSLGESADLGGNDPEDMDGVKVVLMEKAAEAIEGLESVGGVVVVKVVS